jgi:hypothetical protein
MTSRIRPGDDSLEILLNYSIPQKEFNLDDQEMEIPLSRTYRECIIILDEDLCTIKKEQVDRTLPSGNGEDTSVYQEVSIRIGKEQPELQTYTFYISIYDSLNNKQGIYTQELEPVY